MLNEEAEIAVTAPALDDGASRAAADHATPETPGRDVPHQLGDFPAAGEAREEQPRGAGAHATTAILAEHEELADLAHAVTRELRAIADQRKAGEPPGDPDEEVTLAATPEALVPGSGREAAVGPDAPPLTAEVVQIELHQPAHRRALVGTDRTNAPSQARHVAALVRRADVERQASRSTLGR